jgi:hypothetical protein
VSPDPELLKLERLRRQINAEARRFVLQIVLALVVAFGLGAVVGRFFWR